MVPSLLENFNRRTRKTAHQKGGNDMVFSEHEAICHLAVALRMDTKRVEDDLLFVAFSAREFVGLDALRQSAHIYAAFVTRFLVLYKKLGQNKNLAMIEIERECVTIFGTNGVQLCEDFLVKFLSSTSELPLGEWERITKETLVVVESYNRTLLEFSLSLHRGLLHKRHAGAERDIRIPGNATTEVPCPQCKEKKRCDANTKRFRCKKCGYDAPFKNGAVQRPS
ncbi:MAG: hypothetical protein A3D67_04460 [Candidatus Lloydbacteria bacterium RIFCSPHIGHO2_02_FULL_51_22]|uniref:Uncharacterized protein n=3 Tax=Candidatus Lloydiibacteriota TaxID=1817910 RepID=A0A1G2DG40_9BACT|nr:MAG: hypothetical protein A3D67_04460 [Candidatus Lloydbacteria bacterium RIFCSPHIGHO2_02_FULL_51_22]OGZ16791.1 MAG: hypothetical protein A3G11_02895 [Candidatus Lloydbacteria bacterium RIFCSPLOWO2_12_FULL_51_9]